jgi:hypothetical protein
MKANRSSKRPCVVLPEAPSPVSRIYDPLRGYVKSPINVALHAWRPHTPAEAKAMLEDTLGRAVSLTRMAAEYSEGQAKVESDPIMAEAMELLEGLLALGQNMAVWWRLDEEGRP